MSVSLRIFRFLVSFVLASLAAALGISAMYVTKWSRELPNHQQIETIIRDFGAESILYDRQGTMLGRLIPRVGEQAVQRTIVKLEEVSPFVPAAIISNEDRRFFSHYGLDAYGLARQVAKLLKGEDLQGGSTVTNQLVKNTLLFEEYRQARTPDRKFKEWLLSVQVERALTKAEILEGYLNSCYWGDGGPVELYGVASAARAYFGKSARDLTVAESVYLASLVPNPKRYFNYPTVRTTYMKPILERMVTDGWISRSQADAAWKENLQPRGWQVTYDQAGGIKTARLVSAREKELPQVVDARFPHFTRQAEQEVVRLLGRDRVYGAGGLRITTTLDPKVQAAVEQASREAPYAYRTRIGQGLPQGTTLAAVIIEPYSAQVLGMIGQKLTGNAPPAAWNNAAQGQRQIGSTIKPLLYTTALEKGATQQSTFDDRPISIPVPGSGPYEPRNFESQTTFRRMTMREALDRSLNLVTIRVAQFVGLERFFTQLRELGLPPNHGTGYAAALGAVETTPVKLAAAYAPFVNGGLYRPPTYITRVTDAKGNVLYDGHQRTAKRVWTPQVAWLGLDMLRGVVDDLSEQEGGLATRARLPGWPVGGKTGTTNGITDGAKDFWFAGTSPILTGAVWVGKQQSGEMPKQYYSGWVAAPIWQRMMALAHAGKTPVAFQPPTGIQTVTATDQAHLPGVTVATTTKQYLTIQPPLEAADLTVPPPPRHTESTFSTRRDPELMTVYLDRRSGRIATEFTPPDQVIQRQIRPDDLPGYAPEEHPQPLPEETPDPAAVQLVRNTAQPVQKP